MGEGALVVPLFLQDLTQAHLIGSQRQHCIGIAASASSVLVPYVVVNVFEAILPLDKPIQLDGTLDTCKC